MNRRFALTALLIIVAALMKAADPKDVYETCQYEAEDGTPVNYRMLRPVNEVQGEKYPLLVFFHGSGERGDDNITQLKHGGAMFADAGLRAEYPAYVLFPQCPENVFWAYSQETDRTNLLDLEAEPQEVPLMVAVMNLINEFAIREDVDRDRIYIAGLSMGAMAVYDLACRHPEDFAAVVAICGAVKPSRLEAMKNIPTRIYHGLKDDTVDPECSKAAYATLKSLGADVELIEYPNDNHNSWDTAFASPDFLEWIFSQKKAR